MHAGPGRGLPLRTYLPILVVATLAFLGVIGYFLKIGLGVTGAALGPTAASVRQQGDANIRATPAPDEVVVPQTGGGPNGVGGGTPAAAAAGGPHAPVQRMLADLRERLQRDPRDLAALVDLANLYFDAAKYDRAIPYYERALALDPGNPDTRTDYATALHGVHRDLEALQQLDTVLAKRPAFVEALFNEGVVANAVGRRSQAIDAFRRFLRAAPNDRRAADARTALGNLGA